MNFTLTMTMTITMTITAIVLLNYLINQKSNRESIYVFVFYLFLVGMSLIAVKITGLFGIIILPLYHLITRLIASSLMLLIRTFDELYSPNIYPVDNSVKVVILTLTLGLVLGSQIPILNNFNYAHLVYIVMFSTTLYSIIYLLVKNILTPILETRRLQKLYLEKHLQLLKP